jgi:hypothetical protein
MAESWVAAGINLLPASVTERAHYRQITFSAAESSADGHAMG